MSSAASISAKYAASHVAPKGAGDARPTARQVIDDAGLVGKLTGKVILITGCSSGLGVETARALHATGATMFLTVRDVKKGEEIVQDILASNAAVSQSKITLVKMELDSLESVRAAVKDFLSKSSTLNVLINNAGVMACPEGRTKDGFETQIGINHLAHFLLFQLVKSTLVASSTPSFQSRVVNVSSSGHRMSPPMLDDLNFHKTPYNPWVSYGQSKCANIWMANQIERLYGAKGLHAFSLHPGGIYTPLFRHTENDAQLTSMMESPEVVATLKNPSQGAATSVWAAVSPELEGQGGKFLEDVCIIGAQPSDSPMSAERGYAKHAYNEDGEKKLWELSLQLVNHQE